MATTSSAFGSTDSSWARRSLHELPQPEDRQIEPDHQAKDERHRDRERLPDQDADRGADRAQAGGRRDAQRLHAGWIEAKRVADEIELALEVRLLCGGCEPRHLPGDRLADWRHQPFAQRPLELQRDRALPQPELLADQALAKQRSSVGRLRCPHADDDHHDAERGGEADQSTQAAHTTVVIRRMMIVPVARSPTAMMTITHPIGCVNRGWK